MFAQARAEALTQAELIVTDAVAAINQALLDGAAGIGTWRQNQHPAADTAVTETTTADTPTPDADAPTTETPATDTPTTDVPTAGAPAAEEFDGALSSYAKYLDRLLSL
jgi:hypothetical protein